ncbi:MAG: hypothetical protein KatS3mg059_0193 [Thermomicrobiales bacterium]|nr:MAG: hypothetical protein KatS3mg059_0193 [Thermomicrobiales bacterium]
MAEVERYSRMRYYGPERAIDRCLFHEDTQPGFGVIGGYWRCFAIWVRRTLRLSEHRCGDVHDREYTPAPSSLCQSGIAELQHQGA